MKVSIVVASFVMLMLSGPKSLAWGGRGHHTICDAATFLVQDKDLKEFLTNRPHVMGHLCNIPDIYWRSLVADMTKEGNPGHIFDSEIINLPIKDFPLDYKQLITEYEGKKKGTGEGVIRSVSHELGSLWWRADQFYRRALADKDVLAKADKDFKLDKTAEQDENNPFNKAVYNFYVNLGIMGHFVGDAAQPLHNTEDYDGWKKGHGGVHTFYEDKVLSALDGDLHLKVLKEARKLLAAPRKERFLTEKSVLEKMRALSAVSYMDIDALLKADQLKTPSSQSEEHGMKIRKPAERVAIEKTIKKFEPLIVKHMARAAALLSILWNQAYLDAGSPKLSAYKSYRYPLTPDFVFPDYYDIKIAEEAKK